MFHGHKGIKELEEVQDWSEEGNPRATITLSHWADLLVVVVFVFFFLTKLEGFRSVFFVYFKAK